MRTNIVRAVSFVGGVFISASMYLLISKSAIGSGPLFVLEEGISASTGMPFSVVTVLTGILLVLTALGLRAPVGPATFAAPVAFGTFVALLDPVIPSLDDPSALWWATRVAMLIGATHLMMLGAVMIYRASFGAAAVDSVMLGLARVAQRDPAGIRTAMEVSMAVGGWVLGGGAGLGTVIAGLMVGHSFKHWVRVLGRPRHPGSALSVRPVTSS